MEEQLTTLEFAAAGYAFLALLNLSPDMKDEARKEVANILASAPDEVKKLGIEVFADALPTVVNELVKRNKF